MSSVTQAGPQLGSAISASVIETGLRELNVDINFDVAVRKPGEFFHPLEMDPRRRRTVEAGRQPVCYRDTYICAMDRGMVPEFKVWSVREIPVEVSWADADIEGASIQYETIPPQTPGYAEMCYIAQAGSENSLTILGDGRLARLRAIAMKKVRHRILQVGWRHTFTRIIAAGIPGLNAVTIGAKFGVDLFKFPMGTPDEIRAAIYEE